MKKVFRKDLREILAGYAMIAVSLVMLELIAAFGYVTGNQKLTETCLTMVVFAFVLSALYILFSAGRSFLGNLRSKSYYQELELQGVTKPRAVLYKFLYVAIVFTAFFAAFMGALYVNLSISLRTFPESREYLLKLDMINLYNGKESVVASKVAASVFEYLTAGTVMVAMTFFVVIISFTYVMRHKFTGIGSVLLYIFFFGAFLKLYSATIAGRTGVTLNLVAGAMQLAVTIGLMALVLLIFTRKTFPGEIKKRPGEV